MEAPQQLLQQMPRLIREDYAAGDAAARATAIQDLWSILNGRRITERLRVGFARLALASTDGGASAIEDLLNAGEGLKVLTAPVLEALSTTLLGRARVSACTTERSRLIDCIDRRVNDIGRWFPGIWPWLRAAAATSSPPHQIWVPTPVVNGMIAECYAPMAEELGIQLDAERMASPDDLMWIAALAAWRADRACLRVESDMLRRWSAVEQGTTLDHDPLLQLPHVAMLFEPDATFKLGAIAIDGWLAWLDEDGPDGARALCVLPVIAGLDHAASAMRVPLAPGFKRDVFEELVEQAANSVEDHELDYGQRQTLIRVAIHAYGYWSKRHL